MDTYLLRLVEEESAQLLRVSTDLAPLCEQLRGSLAQGKRLRAAFLYWGWRAAGQPDCDGIIRAAAAMELVHAAACTHDDIIDDSLVRHGMPTAHAAFADRALDRGDGHGRDRPVALAMMLGDLLMGYAGQVFATCGLPGAFIARTVPLWSALLRETVAGQFLEVLRTGDGVPQVTESLEVARYKTAKYTVERPLHLGATLGGGSERLLDAFTAYGLPLGEAFQLRDDLLGTFGDPALTGKPNLDDLRDGKPTALMALTVSLVSEDDRQTLTKTVGRPDLDEGEAAHVRRLMETSGACREVEDMITQRLAQAHRALETVPLPRATYTALRELATTSANRPL
ncbi:geranylgeranyl diphosphate synthase type I [Streptomyces griseochromogenes]|uniref:Geranylgeranyl diphosphate synthase type I n=1 Tax=Streptomyces griseochromogenes TaxID=68214 RepID=A0ABS4LJT7_9ACTN|nr:polyprenyl synthetase family protein [Streptomyces griseochromogenes]MBP2047654.1 geranylgeranyl diphosphate synthase type I [Streptomyces griseochromogenes]